MPNKFSKISSIIKDAKKGKMFILVDDKNRENEGDLIIPGSKCTSKGINFMAKHGRGLICLALSKNQVDKLKLPLMSETNKSRMQTAFTISIEAKKGITTGISAYDRAKTIKVAINSNAKRNDIVSPGHVFPLVARSGGVLERAGHTEASVDISKMSKLNPSAVICEVMNEDGRMARLNDLYKFSKKHKIKLIEDCAQSFGAKKNGLYTGTFGDFGCYSFFPTKNLGCAGDGGMIVTNSKKNMIYLKKLRNHGGLTRNIHEYIGYNSRLDEIQAAIAASGPAKLLPTADGVAPLPLGGLPDGWSMEQWESYGHLWWEQNQP